MKKLIKKLKLNKLYSLFDVLPDKSAVKMQHFLSVGRIPNLQDPQRFSEKIHWYKLNYENDLMTQCADKYLMRQYIEKKGYGEYLPKLYAAFNSVDEIDFEALPNSFAIKCNNGSGTNEFVANKSKVNLEELKKVIKGWEKVNTLSIGREWAYKNIPQKIIVEELLIAEDVFQKKNGLNDYKVLCFNGTPEYIWVDVSRHTNHQRNFYNLKWDFKDIKTDKPNSSASIDKPENLKRMIAISQNLAKDFPFVRVDFYEVNKKLYIGELTFYPWSGCIKFTPDQFDYELGKKFDIEQLARKNKYA
ncbi:ATP-grasp fold amidoligase family protein [Exiguobacterium acetylicum]|uniref:ATP-grasp fold amidoligase family protein n=1 Tax=Exiguobacterium acetylicum TaxID=41170 RepID=UPI001EE191F6|nr:ATP-grasp fold amidoligase family protein [Exiguobacterium acetylicum]UKS55704.1 carbonic anhydrase [Exiguobacterium acetylicum]